jgi:hypothetical protein
MDKALRSGFHGLGVVTRLTHKAKKSSPKRAKNGPTRPTNSRCLERNRIHALFIFGNHRILSPRRSRWRLRARAVSRSNPLLPPKFLSHKKERRRRIRKRDYSGAMRIKSVPLLFVDAVGTLVPTNADDRNANAIFIIYVTRVVVSK